MRRAVGVALLFVVVIVVGVGARLGGERIAGQAAAAPRLGAPAPGDCVAEIRGPVSVGLPVGPITVTTVAATNMTFSDCSYEHRGEVIAYRPISSTGEIEPNDNWCANLAILYSRPTVSLTTNPHFDWKPAKSNRFMVILGGQSGERASKWAACVVTSPGFDPYRGSYVRSLFDGPSPAPFGTCRIDDDSTALSSCGATHHVQEFGTTEDEITPELKSTCVELIAQTTGMRDITAGNLLRVDLVASGNPKDSHSAVATTLSCRLSVVGQRSLSGTLVGLGEGRPQWG